MENSEKSENVFIVETTTRKSKLAENARKAREKRAENLRVAKEVPQAPRQRVIVPEDDQYLDIAIAKPSPNLKKAEKKVDDALTLVSQIKDIYEKQKEEQKKAEEEQKKTIPIQELNHLPVPLAKSKPVPIVKPLPQKRPKPQLGGSIAVAAHKLMMW